ncbi:transcriptional regulator [Bradyrhizobium guangdongense]|uniref:Transcriptional regulator n=2 Tax=Bradyrhizobium guangdongense TaxID=1325090 RepID=A0AA87W857_9BRAD|nr:transcriptional regulator [Bradyrhizobium guangdongense]
MLLNAVMGRPNTRALERQARDVAALMRMFANEHRLLIVCKLVEYGEANAGALAEEVGLSASALSQHLAKLKAEGIVAARRDSQTVWYRIADRRVEELVSTLHRLFCGPRKR